MLEGTEDHGVKKYHNKQLSNNFYTEYFLDEICYLFLDCNKMNELFLKCISILQKTINVWNNYLQVNNKSSRK